MLSYLPSSAKSKRLQTTLSSCKSQQKSPSKIESMTKLPNKANRKNSLGDDTYSSAIARESLRVNTGDIKLKNSSLSILMSILQDPIQCGYLLQFCTSEYNSESLCFIMMVSRFRDVICQDSEAWPKKWIEIDEDIKGKDEYEIAHNTVWPSKKLNRPEIAKLIQTISKEFLDEDADNQIFMPAHVATNTKRRVLLLDLYGPDVFVEALLDPIETMNQDILPRFIFSSLKIEMNSRIQSLNTFESPYEISLPSKQKKEIMISLAKVNMHMFEELGKFSLSELNGFFKDYKETESYQNLWQLMAKEKKQTDFLSSFI